LITGLVASHCVVCPSKHAKTSYDCWPIAAVSNEAGQCVCSKTTKGHWHLENGQFEIMLEGKHVNQHCPVELEPVSVHPCRCCSVKDITTPTAPFSYWHGCSPFCNWPRYV